MPAPLRTTRPSSSPLPQNNGTRGRGGVVLGSFITAAHFGLPPIPAAGLTLNLVDSVNSGTIASTDGYGIWVQTGAITNYVNSGVVQGGVAAIDASEQRHLALYLWRSGDAPHKWRL